jgi:hypothetical protein
MLQGNPTASAILFERETMKHNWGKFLTWLLIVAIPAVAIGISNLSVFPDSITMATMLLVITVGVSAIMTYYSGIGRLGVRRYAVVVEILIGIVLWVNLAGHWQLSREVSAAKDAAVERHKEEDREDQREARRSQEKVKEDQSAAQRVEAEKGLAKEQNRSLSLLPRSQRRAFSPVSRATPTPAPIIEDAPTPTPAAAAGTDQKPTKTSAEDVRRAWNPFLLRLAYLEVGLAILGGLGMLGLWNWNDQNHNGIPDWMERDQKRIAELRREREQWEMERRQPRGNLYQFDQSGNLVNAAEGITEEEARRRVGGRDPWPDAPAPVSAPPKPRVKTYPTTGAWDGWKREQDKSSH